jgi:aryl-alcohol dehydrogenase-like predicted oxidoreductase
VAQHTFTLALAPFGVLGGGKYKTEAQRANSAGRAGAWTELNDIDKAVLPALEGVAKRHNASMTSVALAYIIGRAPYVFPLVGGRTVDHIKGNIDALKLRLTEEDVKEIEAPYQLDLGFPHNIMGNKIGMNTYAKVAGWIDHVEQPKVRLASFNASRF